MMVQKNEWLLWPPALLRTPPRIASGTLRQVGDQRVDVERGESRRDPSARLLALVM